MTGCARILESLQIARGQGFNYDDPKSLPQDSPSYGWVSAWHLASDLQVLNYRGRIDELRRRGHTITNHTERNEHGKARSFYRLEEAGA